jgi:hypothetical protein
MEVRTVQREANSLSVSSAALGGVLALALLALVLFTGVAIHELSYASDHPYAYGPAKVIAWGRWRRRFARARGRGVRRRRVAQSAMRRHSTEPTVTVVP